MNSTIIFSHLFTISLLILVMLSGCDSELEPVRFGEVRVCFNAERSNPQDDINLNVSGTVITIEDRGAGTCTHSVTIEDEGGAQYTFGYSITDSFGVAEAISFEMSLSNKLNIDDQVEVLYRLSTPFGSTSGLTISDSEGLLVAVDRGAYDGALEEGDVPDLNIQKSAEFVAETEGGCIPTMGHSITFIADQEIDLIPVSSKEIMINDRPYEAIAIKATSPGTSSSCYESDTISYKAWALFRSP